MPIFKYRGYNNAGSEVSGKIDADGLREAILKIKEQGVFVGEVVEEQIPRRGIITRRPSLSQLPDITRRLSTLLSSGVSLIDTINSISLEQKGLWRNILVDIKEKVSSGSSLSKAMQSHPHIFPEFYTGMVSAGENSGNLSSVLSTLADFLETQMSIKARVRTALVYPVFMGIVGIVVLGFLFIFVVPKITKIFEDTSVTLPTITIILIAVSNLFRRFWWLIIILIILLSLLYKWIKKNKRDWIDLLLMNEPMGIMHTLYMLRFTTTMSFLLEGGLPILNAMRLTSRAIGNLHIEKAITSASDLVSQGAALSNSLEGFPPTLIQTISTGEKTGKLPHVLKRLASSYDAEFNRKLQRVISLLEPSLILVMGFVVGFIVLAVLLPIFELNRLIR